MTAADLTAAAQFIATRRSAGTFPTDQEDAAAALYAWYLNPSPLPDPTGVLRPTELNITAALDAAHGGHQIFTGGWEAQHASTWGRVTATKNGITRLLHRQHYRVPKRPGLRAEPGDQLLVTSAWTWVDEETGFWMSRSGPWPPTMADRLIRIYWNASPKDVPSLVAAITAVLITEGIESFMMKTPASPVHTGRTDAFVLYLAPQDFATVRGAFNFEIDVLLRPPVPRFTRRLRDGLAYSEAPISGESFGDLCCVTIAEALFHTEEAQQETAADSILRILRRGFARAGYDVNHIYRLPNSP